MHMCSQYGICKPQVGNMNHPTPTGSASVKVRSTLMWFCLKTDTFAPVLPAVRANSSCSITQASLRRGQQTADPADFVCSPFSLSLFVLRVGPSCTSSGGKPLFGPPFRLCYFLILANNARDPDPVYPTTSTLPQMSRAGSICCCVFAWMERTSVTVLKVVSFPHYDVSSSLYLLLIISK